MKKKWVEYEIYKNVDGEWENWEGIFSTLAAAKFRYNSAYKGHGQEKDFVIVKATFEVLDGTTKRAKKGSV